MNWAVLVSPKRLANLTTVRGDTPKSKPQTTFDMCGKLQRIHIARSLVNSILLGWGFLNPILWACTYTACTDV